MGGTMHYAIQLSDVGADVVVDMADIDVRRLLDRFRSCERDSSDCVLGMTAGFGSVSVHAEKGRLRVGFHVKEEGAPDRVMLIRCIECGLQGASVSKAGPSGPAPPA